jgi:predicted DNA-binding transcriptional regulator AlpA
MQYVTSIVLTPEELSALVETAVAKALARNPPKPRKSYLDAAEIGVHFGVSRATIHAWIYEDGCPHIKRGKLLRFELAAVEAWFRSRKPSKLRAK